MEKTVLIIGDSLSLCGNEIKYKDTYPYILKTLLPGWDIINLSHRANNTGNLKLMEISGYEADIIVLHLGIVDSFPRLFKPGGLEKRLVSYMPDPVRKKYIRFVYRFRSRRLDWVITRLENFKENITLFTNKNSNVFIVGIASRGEALKNADVYNDFLKQYSIIPPVLDLQSDNVHLTKEGHKTLAFRIFSAIKTNEKNL